MIWSAVASFEIAFNTEFTVIITFRFNVKTKRDFINMNETILVYGWHDIRLQYFPQEYFSHDFSQYI